MRIHSIEKYKGSTFCIEFEEGSRIYLHQELIGEYYLKSGMELTAAEVLKIHRASDLRRARERALYLLTGRDYGYKELFDKLEKNYPEDICLEICDKMVQLRLIDDAQYAQKLAKELLEIKLLGAYRARFEMLRRGLDRTLVDEALEAMEDDTLERLSELVERKYVRYLTDYKGFQKVKAALGRLGYGYSDISAVLDLYEETGE